MPAKRKGKAPAAKAGGKKAKKSEAAAEEDEAPTVSDHINALKAADKGKKMKHKVDSLFPGAASAEVFMIMLYSKNVLQEYLCVKKSSPKMCFCNFSSKYNS